MNIAIIGVLSLLFIGFLVLVWKAAKDWRWYNLVAVIFTMILAIVFIFPTAGALKSRSEWHKIKESLEVRAEQAVAETKSLKFGDPSDASAGPGAIDLAQQLGRLGIEAGRLWRGLAMQGNNPQSIQLNQAAPAVAPGIAPAADADAPPPAPAGPLIPDGLVVYGFAEAQVQGVQAPLPISFLGEFRVTASTPTGVTIVPTGPLESEQQQLITSGQASRWSLYELLPLDAHEPFIAEGSVDDDDNLFGRVDEAIVRSLLKWTPADDDRLAELVELKKTKDAAGQQLTDAEMREYRDFSVRGETFRNYMRDGSRSTADDPPLSRWVKIEFTKNHSIDVDSPQKVGALEGGFFDGNGRAVDSRLQRGQDGTVKFKTGDRITVKEEAAKELTDVEGVARLVDTYYVRPLNDYRFVLRRIRLRLTELAIRTKELTYEKAVLDAAIAATEAMLVSNQQEKLKLEQDLAQTQKESKAIRDYHQQLQEEVKTTRQRLVALYQDNLRREQQLKKAYATVLNAAE